jgi:nucleotide-binding universal stress UspA family protein
VYVVSEIAPEVGEGGAVANSMLRQFQKIGQEVLESLAIRLKVEGVLSPLIVLRSRGPGLQDQVRTLAEYAHRESVDLLVVGTHARTGPTRWMLGSFAELLAFESGLPLYFINPLWKFSENTRRILFPTDFSVDSLYAFERLLYFTKSSASRITLFHRVQFPSTVRSAFGYGLWPIGPGVGLVDAIREAQQIADEWVLKAGRLGVDVTVLIHSKEAQGIVDGILKSALMGYGMIAMAAESGGAATILLGSVTRKVMRGASCPVWVIRKPKVEKMQDVLFHVTEDDISGDLHLSG